MRRTLQVFPRQCLLSSTPKLQFITPTFRTRPAQSFQCIHTSPILREENVKPKARNEESTEKSEAEQKGGTKKGKWDDAIGEVKEKQVRTPWHREGSDKPPVDKTKRQGSAMTKGKLLTTPSRLLKLILPLTILDKDSARKDIEPLALLVHPQQPLSYLERLIQSELPMIEGSNGKEKSPDIFFRAEDSGSDEGYEKKDLDEEVGDDEQVIDGEVVKVGKITKEKKEKLGNTSLAQLESGLRGGPGEGGVEIYGGQGHEGPKPDAEVKFVRWSSSTEIGDFIRDAARGKEFAVEIEGAEGEIRVGVPSFNDRTHYLRVRLRKTAGRLATMASLKKECDHMAHRSAQRLAMGGFGLLASWWGATYYLTFQTSYGWDTMEPVTYLAGLSTIMIGYLWFLYHNREVSYRSALNLTVSKRQNTLYEKRGFDLSKWESLIEEANALRKEIKNVADEYDVEWDEKKDEMTEEVHDALREERKKAKKASEDDEDDDDDDDGGGKKGGKKSGDGKKDD